jgi:hypothetical protein
VFVCMMGNVQNCDSYSSITTPRTLEILAVCNKHVYVIGPKSAIVSNILHFRYHI